MPSHCLGCSSQPPPKLRISPPLTTQVQGRVVLLHGAEDGSGSVVETWGTNDPVGGRTPSGPVVDFPPWMRPGGR